MVMVRVFFGVVLRFVRVILLGSMVFCLLIVVFCVENVGRGNVFFAGWIRAIENEDFCGRDSAAIDLLDLERRSEIEGGCGLMEDPGVQAGIEEGAEKHVSANAGKAVEVGDAHGPLFHGDDGFVALRPT